MTKTLIRPAQPTDFATLLAIDAESFSAEIAYSSSELAYFMRRAGATTLVLEDAETIAAFMILDVARDRRSATIITIDVREEFRRRGFATRLFEHAEALLTGQGVESYRLQVDVNNAAAIAFYARHGFQTARRLRRYYPNGADAWLMLKTLRADAGT